LRIAPKIFLKVDDMLLPFRNISMMADAGYQIERFMRTGGELPRPY
jgi:hypothetical protein